VRKRGQAPLVGKVTFVVSATGKLATQPGLSRVRQSI
jgi:hypothetical protein